MLTRMISIDIYLGDKFFHTMFVNAPKVTPIFLQGTIKDCIDLKAVADEVRQRLPSLRNRNDMVIYLNN